MVWFTIEEFLQWMGEDCKLIKCSHCDKNASWWADKDSPAYCDEHFPYRDIRKTQISVDDPLLWNKNNDY